MSRPNKEVIHAWLDGKDIQYRRDPNPKSGWINFAPEGTDENPMLDNETQWRVKSDEHQIKKALT